MKKILGIVITVVLFAVPVMAEDVVFEWNPVTTNADGTPINDLKEYRLYASTQSMSYGDTPICIVPEGVHSCTVTTPMENVDGFFVLTAVDDYGNESGYSNEISRPFPGLPPAVPQGFQFSN